jgi:hypothetical protein
MKRALILCLPFVIQFTFTKAASVVPQKNEPGLVHPKKPFSDWGYYTGYLLGNDGCYHHGTFYWSGSPQNYMFEPDQNPASDDYWGNEDICMTDGEWEYLC